MAFAYDLAITFDSKEESEAIIVALENPQFKYNLKLKENHNTQIITS